MKPHRIKLSRKAGFNLQKFSMELNGLPAVNCARPGAYGNPYTVKEYGRHNAIAQFKWLVDKYNLESKLKNELRGKNLACWCDLDEECHCDFLLEISNP